MICQRGARLNLTTWVTEISRRRYLVELKESPRDAITVVYSLFWSKMNPTLTSRVVLAKVRIAEGGYMLII